LYRHVSGFAADKDTGVVNKGKETLETEELLVKLLE